MAVTLGVSMRAPREHGHANLLRWVMPRRTSWMLALAIGACAMATCGAETKIRSDEFLCEEAHARLVECCPGFRTESSWCSYETGCGATQYTALDEAESNCIRKSSCTDLNAHDVCRRAALLTAPRIDDDAGTAPYARAKVCP